jgi:hypothetical protein
MNATQTVAPTVVGPKPTTAQSQEEVMEQLMMLYQNLRNVRHTINNHVAVIMAMAEWSQRHPEQSDKLTRMCIEKSPQIVMAMRGFSDLFEGALKRGQ